MPRLQSSNFAIGGLQEQILDSAVSPLSFEISNAAAFPDAPFRILVREATGVSFVDAIKEIMEVGAINKVTGILSDVTREQEGTSAQTHDIGAKVECVWTSGTHGELADGADLSNVENKSSEDIRTEYTTALAVEVRTTDPVSPAVGRMWLRSDL